ncbi:MAG: prepilin-type N-terminal cleavage/methylation domain-containing protein, partial [Deltaproteobacteria bacterium]|nr:prepilin-type N-terminal cleavage/methylation domain-containing protein [Deltaproteobacteria bacterium]
MTGPRRRAKGFTLVEVIAASVILCGAVMLVGRVGTQAMTGTKLNRRYEMAVSLIDKQLTLVDYLGIDAFLEAGEFNGQFDDFGYAFQWDVETEYQEIDSLYSVKITVTWAEGRRPYSIAVDTMFDGV